MTEKTFCERFDESLENQKRLISSTEYFDWLYEFTKKHRKFTDTDWLYEFAKKYRKFTDTDWLHKKDPNMSEHDYNQVGLLTDFFTSVDQYHRRNLLKANTEGYAVWYNIKYKDAYFAIGIRVGQGATNFVTRYEKYESMIPEPFIEFEYIMEDRTAPGLDEKQEKLQQLQEIAIQLENMGTPKEALENVINQIFKKEN